MEIHYDVRPRRAQSVYIECPFDEGIKELAKAGYRVISAEENARLRIQEGKDALISREGNIVREGIIYMPGDFGYLTKCAPEIEDPIKATRCSRKNKELYPSKEQIERAIDSSVSVKFPYPEDSYHPKRIPVDRLAEEETTRFMFGDSAERYGEFLKEIGMKNICLNIPYGMWMDQLRKPYSEILFFGEVLDFNAFTPCFGAHLPKSIRGVPITHECGKDSGIDFYAEEDISELFQKAKIPLSPHKEDLIKRLSRGVFSRYDRSNKPEIDDRF